LCGWNSITNSGIESRHQVSGDQLQFAGDPYVVARWRQARIVEEQNPNQALRALDFLSSAERKFSRYYCSNFCYLCLCVDPFRMRILNGIIGQRNNQDFFSIDCAAVKEEGWGGTKLEGFEAAWWPPCVPARASAQSLYLGGVAVCGIALCCVLGWCCELDF
jgi:hypothetical protein